jgi:hypothetical protein
MSSQNQKRDHSKINIAIRSKKKIKKTEEIEEFNLQ